jgi:16S rRNA (cytosine1402-N4)-methyltransferase
MSNFTHEPVMKNEVLELISGVIQPEIAASQAPRNDRATVTIVDGTLGLGGHTKAILEQFPSVKVIGVDQDRAAIEIAAKNLENYSDRFTVIESNFLEASTNIKDESVTVWFLDLGVSSMQLDDDSRGFSYRFDSELDMRMAGAGAGLGTGETTPSADGCHPFRAKGNEIAASPLAPRNDELGSGTGVSAKDVLNSYSEEELVRVFKEFGEERYAKGIAKGIVGAGIVTSGQLKQVIEKSIPKGVSPVGSFKRVFQALRIEVNQELQVLEQTLNNIVNNFPNLELVIVLSYHSLEDKIVKRLFKNWSDSGDIIELPVQLPEFKSAWSTRNSAIKPTTGEIENNPRAKSALLRYLRKAA